ncbi:Por secretion system C-terminal sorting domain-containing protein [Hymenobacter daecheongensis DSM 21074]|uniref:Por secretion system C-terminal sorting domain-containing protein n=1 Tax=Hymenobacter daecheongensis DSM 21074 TaxID=1121955 RepID=A0A1M6ERG9_9BACT|nr:alpha/beta hydrolase-fold protein [Hymenobacter daecheongensis]SHI88072.1 Por secretion system C-terminal sorting domain-containing protein [Hymenobacter daecheongensis DSM 21074]
MKRTALLILLSLLGVLGAQAQLTLKLTSIPANTPAGAVLYVAGSFNSWNPGSAAHALTKNADGTYQITLPQATGTIEYKFTRGSWAAVETNATNGPVPNRSHTYTAGPATVTHTVLNWEDLGGGSSCQSTAVQPNVQILSASFVIPQLGRTRRVWLYLPTDYATSTRRYPVLYMHDGQNVFDACTSFSGEWGVDETLKQLQQQGLDATGSIVVAIDNGGGERLNEYSPWSNPQYGGGQGDQYVDFLVQTLKPYIDTNYRTLTGREYTGIAGSSMGGLISTYAALKYPAVFGKVGVFSPAFWFAQQPLFQYVRQHPANPDTRFYFVSGTQESQTMVPLMQAMRDSLQRGGVPAANLSYNPRTDGQHAEWFWKREFAAAYQWLYAPAGPTATKGSRPALAFSAYPNPAKNALTVQLPATVKEARLEVLDSAGRGVLKSKVYAGQTVDVSRLAKGTYFLRLTAGKQVGTQSLLKE